MPTPTLQDLQDKLQAHSAYGDNNSADFKAHCLAYLAAGGDVNARSGGLSLLESAIINPWTSIQYRLEIVAFLLEKKANIHCGENGFPEPLRGAVFLCEDPAPIVELLVKHGVNPNVKRPETPDLLCLLSIAYPLLSPQKSDSLVALIKAGADTTEALASHQVTPTVKNRIRAILAEQQGIAPPAARALTEEEAHELAVNNLMDRMNTCFILHNFVCGVIQESKTTAPPAAVPQTSAKAAAPAPMQGVSSSSSSSSSARTHLERDAHSARPRPRRKKKR